MTSWQRSLFDPGESADLDPEVRGLSRTELAGGAWVDHLPGWIRRHDLLFDELVGAIDWRAEQRLMYERRVDVPRLVAVYPEGEALPHPLLVRARDVLDARYGDLGAGRIASVGTCLYRDGRDSVAWHGDRIAPGTTRDTLVAIVGLGQPRRFLLRPAGGGPSVRFDHGAGDLLIMGGRCQQAWEHCVPKTTGPAGPRLSIQFRSAGAG